MAAINAYFQFDMMTLNLNNLASGYYDFFDNEYAPYGDTVYEDVFSFNYAQNRYGIFGGSGFALDGFGRVSGTVQGYVETYGERRAIAGATVRRPRIALDVVRSWPCKGRSPGRAGPPKRRARSRNGSGHEHSCASAW